MSSKATDWSLYDSGEVATQEINYLDSAILRLAKERNEARNLAKQLFWALPAGGGHVDEQSVNAAYYSFIKASREWKEGEQ